MDRFAEKNELVSVTTIHKTSSSYITYRTKHRRTKMTKSFEDDKHFVWRIIRRNVWQPSFEFWRKKCLNSLLNETAWLKNIRENYWKALDHPIGLKWSQEIMTQKYYLLQPPLFPWLLIYLTKRKKYLNVFEATFLVSLSVQSVYRKGIFVG